VLGGLSVSTVLSLLVVPAFYVVADRLKTRLGAWRGKRPDDEAGTPARHGPQGPGEARPVTES